MTEARRSATLVKIVAEHHTAAALGSGDLAVLGTPQLLAWCEEATCACLDLPAASTSVGANVKLEHLAPSAVGERITIVATLTEETARGVEFTVVAHNASGREIGRCSVVRAIVDRERFLARLAQATAPGT